MAARQALPSGFCTSALTHQPISRGVSAAAGDGISVAATIANTPARAAARIPLTSDTPSGGPATRAAGVEKARRPIDSRLSHFGGIGCELGNSRWRATILPGWAVASNSSQAISFAVFRGARQLQLNHAYAASQ